MSALRYCSRRGADREIRARFHELEGVTGGAHHHLDRPVPHGAHHAPRDGHAVEFLLAEIPGGQQEPTFIEDVEIMGGEASLDMDVRVCGSPWQCGYAILSPPQVWRCGFD